MSVRAWLRGNLFPDPANALLTLALLAAAAFLLPGIFEWAVADAVLRPSPVACRAAGGACWGVIAEKWRLILFGRFPYGEQWRPALAIALVLAPFALLPGGRVAAGGLAALWAAAFAFFVFLLKGGAGLLEPVESERWGGLALTILLAAGGFAGGFPLAVLLALARRGRMPVLRAAATVYVETLRGLPLVPVLFVAAFVFPLLLPPAWAGDLLLRVGLAIALFAAAYLAEVVRGGLQAIAPGQEAAAAALGLGYWQTQRQVLLPQALAATLPALVGSAIALFKDVSLVTVVSLYELSGSLSLALAGDAEWRPYYLEGYVFVGFIYWLGCSGLARLGAALERRCAPVASAGAMPRQGNSSAPV